MYFSVAGDEKHVSLSLWFLLLSIGFEDNTVVNHLKSKCLRSKFSQKSCLGAKIGWCHKQEYPFPLSSFASQLSAQVTVIIRLIHRANLCCDIASQKIQTNMQKISNSISVMVHPTIFSLPLKLVC